MIVTSTSFLAMVFGNDSYRCGLCNLDIKTFNVFSIYLEKLILLKNTNEKMVLNRNKVQS